MSATSMAKNKDFLRAFVERLVVACDNCADIPPPNQGRQSYIAKRLGVSTEAVSKYFSAEAMPRKARMATLAQLLHVDLAWLELGVRPEVEFNRRNIAERMAEGSVMIVAGILKTMGAACTIPDEKSSRGGSVDIYAIVGPKMLSIHVSQMRKRTERLYEVVVPSNYDELTCVAFLAAGSSMIVLDLPGDVIDEHKVRRNDEFTVTIELVDDNFMVGDSVLCQFNPT